MKYFIFLLLMPFFGQAQKPIFVKATVKSATVYFSSAEISQSVKVNLPKGTSEIVVKNVADYLNESSIQIGAPAAVTVLSVQFSNDYISEFEIDEKNPDIKKVRDSITFIEKEIKRTTNARDSDIKTIELLDKNQQVWGSNSGLNVGELTKMVMYYKLTRTEIRNNFDNLEAKLIKLGEQLANLQNKLEVNTDKEEKSSKGKLILQVMNEVAGSVDIDVNYLTNAASWKPFYDLRANNVTEPINMIYKAQVTQNSGIDWKKVKLTLSSGNPNQSNVAPELNSWFLKYRQNENLGYLSKSKEPIAYALQGRVAGVQITEIDGIAGANKNIKIRGNRPSPAGKIPLYVINGNIETAENFKSLSPTAIKNVNILKGADATAIYGEQGANGVVVVTTKNMNDYTSIDENQLNISFDIDLPYDILSNGKPHSVALKEIKVLAFYQYYAAPRAEKEAFLTAKIVDYAKFNLLPGEANIVFEGLYVGKTFINANATSDTLTLGMGRDKKIAIKREKVIDKSGVKFLSSKKEQTFTYDITIRNNKKDAIELLLKDQFPLSTEEAIETELLESSGAQINKETGVLSWTLSIKPAETKKLRLSYKVRYPKDKVLDNL